jgi:hypothetical protein
MELDQEPTNEDGKFRQVRTGAVLKDRFGVIDGSVFTFHKGANHAEEMQAVWDAFSPHLNMLKPGSHSTVITAASTIPVSDEGDVQWGREKQARTILCEEIQGAIVSVHPGQSAEEKKKKADLLQQIFSTRSWTRIEGMPSETLRDGLGRLREALGIPTQPEGAPAPIPDELDQIPGAEVPSKPEDICTKIRQLLQRDHIVENVLLGYLQEIGTLEGVNESLEEANKKQPALLPMVLTMWKEISDKINDALGRTKTL